MKKCRSCGLAKSENHFYKQANGTLMPDCKPCRIEKVKANRLANIDRYRAYDKDRDGTPHRVEARKIYSVTAKGRAAAGKAKRRFAELNPVKRAAHIAVANALKTGALVRLPCDGCGRKAQAHHDDYSKPLSVRWLCASHHSEWHKHNTPLCPDQEIAA
jgi:hypothetical protein